MNIEETNNMLSKAVKAGDLDKAKEAIKQGADYLDYALRLASEYGHIGIVKSLIKHGANNFNDALRLAAIYGHPKVVEKVVEILKQKIKGQENDI